MEIMRNIAEYWSLSACYFILFPYVSEYVKEQQQQQQQQRRRANQRLTERNQVKRQVSNDIDGKKKKKKKSIQETVTIEGKNENILGKIEKKQEWVYIGNP